MKIKIGAIYRCLVPELGGFTVRVLDINKNNTIYGESVSDPEYYEKNKWSCSSYFEGKPCGTWSVGDFKRRYIPVLNPCKIWKDLNA